MSELRLYCDLLMQQVHTIQESVVKEDQEQEEEEEQQEEENQPQTQSNTEVTITPARMSTMTTFHIHSLKQAH